MVHINEYFPKSLKQKMEENHQEIKLELQKLQEEQKNSKLMGSKNIATQTVETEPKQSSSKGTNVAVSHIIRGINEQSSYQLIDDVDEDDFVNIRGDVRENVNPWISAETKKCLKKHGKHLLQGAVGGFISGYYGH